MFEQIKSHHLDLVYPKLSSSASYWSRLRIRCFYLITVDEDNPRTIEFFRSEVAILKEKTRHYEKYRYMIHPLSKFRLWYDFYVMFLYAILLVTKPIEAAFVRVSRCYPMDEASRYAIYVFLFLDILSILDIAIQFVKGIGDSKNRKIELSFRKISKRYLLSYFFIFDLLSSVPKIVYYSIPEKIFIFVNCCCYFKLLRLYSCLELIGTSSGIKSTYSVFIIRFFFSILIFTHTMTSLHYGIPRFNRLFFGSYDPDSWVVRNKILDRKISSAYVFSFFRSSAYSMGISINMFGSNIMEEHVLSLINYVVGKVIVVTTWIVLVHVILSARALKIKFQKIKNELNEYMTTKQLPQDLKDRLNQYYDFKYQYVFFNESTIKSLLSFNLKQDIELFLSKRLIYRVSLFSMMDPKDVREIVSFLISEIYLPNDTIIQSGTYGNAMYFIASGTVALYTHSGKEVCHLQDGAYFGELSLIIKDQKQRGTLKAVEVTKVYKLTRKYFNMCIRKNAPIFESIVENAEKKLRAIEKLEESYRKKLFEMEFNNQ